MIRKQHRSSGLQSMNGGNWSWETGFAPWGGISVSWRLSLILQTSRQGNFRWLIAASTPWWKAKGGTRKNFELIIKCVPLPALSVCRLCLSLHCSAEPFIIIMATARWDFYYTVVAACNFTRNISPVLLFAGCNHRYSYTGKKSHTCWLTHTHARTHVKPNISTAVFSSEPGASLDRGRRGGNILVAALEAHRNLQAGRLNITTLRNEHCLPALNKHKRAPTDRFLAYNTWRDEGGKRPSDQERQLCRLCQAHGQCVLNAQMYRH